MISVIVPVYNAEKYLAKCVDSILNQSFTDYELILVNDGSTDSSPHMCDEYSRKDIRIKVIHTENEGCGLAREKALKESCGEYICFIDADDYISPDYLQRLYNDLIKEDADIACCKTLEIDGAKEDFIDSFCKYEIITRKERLVADCISYDNVYAKVVWAKLIKRSTIGNTHFSPIRFSEDSLYMYKIYRNVKKVVLDPFCGYFYFRNSESITKKAETSVNEVFILMDHLLSSEALMLIGTQCSSEYQKKANRKYANDIFSTITRMIKNQDKELYSENKAFFRHHVSRLKGLSGIPFKCRFVLSLYTISPDLLWTVYSCFKML